MKPTPVGMAEIQSSSSANTLPTVSKAQLCALSMIYLFIPLFDYIGCPNMVSQQIPLCFLRFSLLLFMYSCLPPPLPPPTLNPIPLWLCLCVLNTCSLRSLSLLSPSISLSPPLWLLSVCSMSLVIFCLLVCFVDYVPLKGEIIWYLSFTIWLISLSIMLSSSIHAVAKEGVTSFFLLHGIPLCKCTIVF